jgi:hypothetical protein
MLTAALVAGNKEASVVFGEYRVALEETLLSVSSLDVLHLTEIWLGSLPATNCEAHA